MMCRHAALQSILRIIILRCSALSLKATPLSNPTSSWGGLLLRRKLTEGQPDYPQNLIYKITFSFLLMKLQELTAVAMLTFGVLLAMLGFWVVPTGQVDESVLWLFAQCLIYAGSVMGVTVYVRRWGERLAKGD